MKRYLSILLVFVGATFAVAAPSGLTVDQVLNKARNHIGDEPTLNGVKSLSYKGSVELFIKDESKGGDAEPVVKKAQLIASYKRPYLQRVEVYTPDFVEVRAANQDVAWVTRLTSNGIFAIDILPYAELRSMRANSNENLCFFLGVEKFGGKSTLEKDEVFEGVTCHVVNTDYDGKNIYRRYFDVATGKLVATRQPGDVVIKEEGQFLSGGIRFPKTLSTYKDGTLIHRFVFEQVQVNPEVADSMFERPQIPHEGSIKPYTPPPGLVEAPKPAGPASAPKPAAPAPVAK